MSWMWVAGAALAALCSVACGVNIGARVSSGKEAVWSSQVLIWVIGFHGVVGVAALMMLVQSRG